MNNKEKIWVERYRPTTLSEVILSNDRERTAFEAIVESGALPNLLLVGTQGTGKTSMSGALINDLKVHPEDVLRINCSNKKIDAIREEVATFAFTMATGNFRVVQLEEMDYLSLEGQALLRVLMEDVQGHCSFIATANYLNKIIPAMRSRFGQEIIFSKPSKDEILLRAADILVKENVEFEVDDLEKVVEAGYPDIRRVIHILQAGSRTGTLLVADAAEKLQDWKLQLLPLLEAGDLNTARTMICASATREELPSVYPFLYQNLGRIKSLAKKQDEAIVLIAEYQHKQAFVDDGEIQLAALFIELGAL